MADRRLPGFVAEVVDDRTALRTLAGAALAIAAAGLDPRILSPGLPTVQSALRARPELEALAALLGVAAAAALLIGGVAGDSLRTRRVLLAGLVGLAVTAAGSLVFAEGPLLVATRFCGAIAAGLVVPFALASVAMAYTGTARATAIGLVYGAYGGALALPPILLTITGPGGSAAPAYLAAAIGAIVAAPVAARVLPDLPGAAPARIGFVATIAVWAFGVIAVAAGLSAVGSGAQPSRLLTIGLGLVGLVVGGALWARARHRGGTVPVAIGPVTVVLAAGLFIGFAQAIPMTLLPAFFDLVLGFGPIAAAASIAPLIVALVIAGPVAGWLLPIASPRVLIGGGLVAIGLGDIFLGLVVSTDAGYLVFVLPFVLVGAGFVIATTVRTAVIFASVPRDLPASAAALNEASVGIGSRIGIATGVVVMTEVALAAYAGSLPPGTDVEAAIAPFHDLLIALGTPGFASVAAGVDRATAQVYAAAYVEGIRVVHVAVGTIAVVAGVLAAAALGRRDPLRTVWEHGDERA